MPAYKNKKTGEIRVTVEGSKNDERTREDSEFEALTDTQAAKAQAQTDKP